MKNKFIVSLTDKVKEFNSKKAAYRAFFKEATAITLGAVKLTKGDSIELYDRARKNLASLSNDNGQLKLQAHIRQ